jgi:hypothetical protein
LRSPRKPPLGPAVIEQPGIDFDWPIWSCGHHGARPMCGECYSALASKAHELQMELNSTREQVEAVTAKLRAAIELLQREF